MEYHDYYGMLGLSKEASADEIKKQYRKLARKYHPDVSKEPNAEEKFKEMKEAYEVLKDPEKRKAYDQMGQGFNNGDHFTPPPGWEYESNSETERPHSHYSSADFSDFFNSIFGQKSASGQQSRNHKTYQERGIDQHAKITVTLEEAFFGCEKGITLQRQTLDPQTQKMSNTEQTLKIKIPAGVTHNQQIRLKGQGSNGFNGGENGDLYLEINIHHHTLYTFHKKDIYLTLPITPWEAALGEKIEIPTLGGTILFTLPAGSQSGNKLRLKGRGLPGKIPGDQYITLSIKTPSAETEEQKTYYQKMAQTMPFNPRKQML